jgi:hypothetical protein
LPLYGEDRQTSQETGRAQLSYRRAEKLLGEATAALQSGP